MAVIIVRVRPGAARQRIGPFAAGVLSLAVTRPPQDGEATEAARRLLAEAVGVAPSRVRLQSGARSRLKRFQVNGLADDVAAERLARHRSPSD
ncbi:MAG TPA: DUF167 domain-containing protein [Candidatus Limnocylindria bacterium]|nr:DUF167 domain-containing protein [Candidatus Limnocylindria bacterium]